MSKDLTPTFQRSSVQDTNEDVGDEHRGEKLPQVVCECQETSLEQSVLKDVSPPTVPSVE